MTLVTSSNLMINLKWIWQLQFQNKIWSRLNVMERHADVLDTTLSGPDDDVDESLVSTGRWFECKWLLINSELIKTRAKCCLLQKHVVLSKQPFEIKTTTMTIIITIIIIIIIITLITVITTIIITAAATTTVITIIMAIAALLNLSHVFGYVKLLQIIV